ncbi:MAG: hypothetical protein Q7K57_59435 [Burkholderiaceae bacterium]|nr:hypothetical protein [Burkholderiaceae bacterium]
MTASGNTTTVLIDHHLKMVGTLVNNAAICDLVLFSAFKIISGCEGKIASAIYFSSETIQAKKNIIGRILKVIGDQTETKIVQRIISATEKSQNQRNELSHALLQVSGEGNQLLRFNARHQDQPGKPVTGPYLDGLLKQSSVAHLEAHRAFQELCQKRGISPSISHE